MRSTMAGLVRDVRLLANAGNNDFTIGVVSYWSDDQILALLDQHRIDLRYHQMTPVPVLSGGVTTYFEYLTGYSSWEENPTIQDNAYATQGTASYSFDATTGVCTFVADTTGAVRLITGAVYDINAVAAEIWTRKAAHYGLAYDVSTDNHTLSRSQLVRQCEGMARTFKLQPPSYTRGRGASQTASVMAERPDTVGY